MAYKRPLGDRVFNMMEAVADETSIDFSKETLNRVLPRSAAGKSVIQSDFEKSISDKRLTVGQIKANKSFDKLMKQLNTHYDGLTELESSKIKELWIAGGKPIINIQKKGTKGTSGDTNRASFTNLPVGDEFWKHTDQVNIFEHDLLDDFLAEISHSKKYARKPNEKKEEWIKRREKLQKLIREEDISYKEKRYGEIKDGKKYFPKEVAYDKVYSVGEKDGKEIVVDEEGNFYPDMKIPQWQISYNPEGEETGRSRALSWGYPTSLMTEFNPETRLGIGGEKLTQEFEAHSVVEDSLWNVLKKSGLFSKYNYIEKK